MFNTLFENRYSTFSNKNIDTLHSGKWLFY